MVLDFIALTLLFFYALAGFTRGLMVQLVGLVGMAAVWFLAPPFAPVFRRLIFSSPHRAAPHIEIGCLLIAAAAILIVVHLIVGMIPSTLRRWSDRVRRLDATLGTAAGVARGVVTIYLLACALVYVEAPLSRRYASMDKAFAESRVMEEVRRNNLLTTLGFRDLERLRSALAAWGRPAVRRGGSGRRSAGGVVGERAEESPEEQGELADRIERLRTVEAFRAAANNPELRRLARERRTSELLEHPQVRQLLADERVLEALGGRGWTPLDGWPTFGAGGGEALGAAGQGEGADGAGGRLDRGVPRESVKKKPKKKPRHKRKRSRAKARPRSPRGRTSGRRRAGAAPRAPAGRRGGERPGVRARGVDPGVDDGIDGGIDDVDEEALEDMDR